MKLKNTFLITFLILQSVIFAGSVNAGKLYVGKQVIVNPVSGDSISVKAAAELLTNTGFDVAAFYPGIEGMNVDEVYKISSSSDGTHNIAGSKYEIKIVAGFIENFSFVKGDLKITCDLPLNLYIDNESVFDNSALETAMEKGEYSKEVKLETGKHFFLVKLFFTEDKNVGFKIEFTGDNSEKVKFTDNHYRTTTVSDLLDNRKIKGVSVSGDGSLALVKINERNVQAESVISSYEIYNTNNGSIAEVILPADDIDSPEWIGEGQKLAYTVTQKKLTTVYVKDFSDKSLMPVLKNVKDFGGMDWSKDGKVMFYSITQDAPEKKDLFRYEYPQSRFPWYGRKNSIYMFDVSTGISRPVVTGDDSYELIDISPDNNKILYYRNEITMDERPYEVNHYYIYDITSGKTDSLFTEKWAGGASFSPDGKKLAVLSGPAGFDGSGLAVSGKLPNDFDMQLFLYDLESKKVEVLSKEFDPYIGSADWNSSGDKIYLQTTDKSKKVLYVCDLNEKKFTQIDLGIEYLNDIEFPVSGEKAVYYGSSANQQEKVYLYDFIDNTYSLLTDPDSKNNPVIKTGEVDDFNFTSSKGFEITGRVYYPVNYDENKKYPAIVYYYGGTSPVTREFEGRYPKNIWAANGYFVYVLQPRGAYGFGQEYSSTHVNDWGNETAIEIMEGAEKFCEKYPAVDPERLGCIGASYGGFMTMNLITKTDMFAAAISHAGISDLTSYWGEGYWGFLYSAVASAESFPWNNRKLYVDHSPIFSADKIHTPLLLLHGNSDTNVPRGESIQMYTALKLLGRDVELIEVDGQDHHILEYKKRKEWTKTIVAYFDKYLKNEPLWFNTLYPEKK